MLFQNEVLDWNGNFLEHVIEIEALNFSLPLAPLISLLVKERVFADADSVGFRTAINEMSPIHGVQVQHDNLLIEAFVDKAELGLFLHDKLVKDLVLNVVVVGVEYEVQSRVDHEDSFLYLELEFLDAELGDVLVVKFLEWPSDVGLHPIFHQWNILFYLCQGLHLCKGAEG